MRVITVWEAAVMKDQQIVGWSHNHIEDGYPPPNDHPVPAFQSQHGWTLQKWRATRATLIDGVVVQD